jgi:hypothetical protein
MLCTIGIALFCSFLTTMASAQVAICDHVLLLSYTQSNEQENTRYSYLKLIDEEEWKTISHGGDAGLDIPVAGKLIGAYASYKDFQDALKKEFDETKFTFSNDQSRSFIQSQLTSDTIKGWVDCITKGAGVAAWIEPGQANVDHALVHVSWRPGPGAGTFQKVMSDFTGGYGKMPAYFSGAAETAVIFHRVPAENSLFVSITVGITYASNATLVYSWDPPPPPKKVDLPRSVKWCKINLPGSLTVTAESPQQIPGQDFNWCRRRTEANFSTNHNFQIGCAATGPWGIMNDDGVSAAPAECAP